jgi:lipid-binding SYLF domain-containing protein
MTLAVMGAMIVAPARAQDRALNTLQAASDTLEALRAVPLKGIPPALLREAHGVAIVPGVIRAGFVFGGRFGHGVVFVRNDDGTWAGPVFMVLAGGSFGLQAGVQSTDVVLVFKTRKSLDRILAGKGKVTLGGDVGVAAGPVGLQAEAGTDAQLKAEIYSYSRSRGLFAGVSVAGAVLHADAATNQAFQQGARPEAVAWVERIKTQLAIMASPQPPAGVPVIVGPPIVPPPATAPLPTPPSPLPPPGPLLPPSP